MAVSRVTFSPVISLVTITLLMLLSNHLFSQNYTSQYYVESSSIQTLQLPGNRFRFHESDPNIDMRDFLSQGDYVHLEAELLLESQYPGIPEINEVRAYLRGCVWLVEAVNASSVDISLPSADESADQYLFKDQRGTLRTGATYIQDRRSVPSAKILLFDGSNYDHKTSDNFVPVTPTANSEFSLFELGVDGCLGTEIGLGTAGSLPGGPGARPSGTPGFGPLALGYYALVETEYEDYTEYKQEQVTCGEIQMLLGGGELDGWSLVLPTPDLLGNYPSPFDPNPTTAINSHCEECVEIYIGGNEGTVTQCSFVPSKTFSTVTLKRNARRFKNTKIQIVQVCTPAAPPSATILERPGAGVCEGNGVTLYPKDYNNGLNKYDWSVNDNGTITNYLDYGSEDFVVPRKTNGQTVILTVTRRNADACDAEFKNGSDDHPVAAGAATGNVLNVDVSNPGQVCDGLNYSVSGSTTNGQGILTYSWFVDGSPYGGNTPSISVPAVLGNTRDVDLTISSDYCGQYGTFNDRILPAAKPKTDPTIAITASSEDYTYCDDENVSITATVSGAEVPVINWQLADGTPVGSSGSNGAPVSLPANVLSYVAVGSDNNGCTVDSDQTTFEVKAEVVNSPTITIVPPIGVPAESSVCHGTSVTVTPGPMVGDTDASKYTIKWSRTDKNSGITEQPYTDITTSWTQSISPGINTFTLELIPTHRCDIGYSTSINVYGYDPLPLGDQVGANAIKFCEGQGTSSDGMQTRVLAGAKEADMNYRLVGANTYLPTGDPSQVIFEDIPPGTYTVRSNHTSCIDIDLDVAQIEVIMMDEPSSSITISEASPVCQNTAQLQVTPGGSDYKWYRGYEIPEDQIGAGSATYFFTPNDVGYSQNFISTFNLHNEHCVFPKYHEQPADVDPPLEPMVDLELVGSEDNKICANDPLEYRAYLTNVPTGATYQWTIIENGVSEILPSENTASDDQILTLQDTLSESATVRLEVTGISGCTTSSSAASGMRVNVNAVEPLIGVLELAYCKYSPGLDLELGGAERGITYILFRKTMVGGVARYDSLISDPATGRDGSVMRFGLKLEGDYKISGFVPDCGESPSDTLEYVQLRIRRSITPCLNYVTTRSSSESGIYNQSRSFFDLTGDHIQDNHLRPTGTEMVSQTKYDGQDRAALSTLPAKAPVPDSINLHIPLDYYTSFVTADTGKNFGYQHWDRTIPLAVDTDSVGSLGHYYSDSNTEEPFTDRSAYPYIKTDFYDDGTGEVKTSYGPGEPYMTDYSKRSYQKTFPVGNELDGIYRTTRNLMLNYPPAVSNSLRGEAMKVVQSDPHGRETITFTDTEGNPVVSAYANVSGGIPWGLSFDSESLGLSIVDFHLPQATTISVPEFDGGLTNLITDQEVNSLTSVPKGCYRLIDGDVSFGYTYYNASFNFYDDRGKLIASVPPLGVADMINATIDSTYAQNIPYATYYKYDYRGRMISMREPDVGETFYIYRNDGSIRYSQNALQRTYSPKRFSYTTYDRSGRPVESGEYWGKNDVFGIEGLDFLLKSNRDLLYPTLEKLDGDSTFLNGILNRNDFVRTTYDLVDADPSERYDYSNIQEMSWRPDGLTELKVYDRIRLLPGFVVTDGARFKLTIGSRDTIDNRVVQDFVQGAVSVTENKNTKTWYTYDEQGRVKEISVWYKGLSSNTKNIEYSYDVLGNVTDVKYDGGEAGEPPYYHHYVYDSSKRLHKVYASLTTIDPANLNINDLQATYYYYLHGPLKRVELGANTQGIDYVYNLQGQLKSINDPNNTDFGGETAAGFYADAFSQQYGYYAGDYQGGAPLSVVSPASGKEQYNGNIAQVNWHATSSSVGPVTATGKYAYQYDDRSYLTDATYNDGGTNRVSGLTYDANGNILNLNRTGLDISSDSSHHLFSYQYITGTNRLDTVRNSATGAGDYGIYSYNTIGQMTKRITAIPDSTGYYQDSLVYDVTGKLIAVYDATGSIRVEYAYDDRGFRVSAIETNGNYKQQTLFMRDGAGQLLAVYDVAADGTLARKEISIHGAGRLGTVDETFSANPLVNYELKDHLGNVRSVVARSYGAGEGILSRSDYYPFGSPLPGRKISSPRYRFGYQGDFSEEDDETGLSHFTLRDWDPVIGKWLTVDPERQFASPYLGMGNNPVNRYDPTGGFSPIYDKDGNFLGTDSEGFTGDVLIMSQEEFNFLSSFSADGVIDHGIASMWGENIGGADLSFQALSSIYTDVIAQMGSEVDMSFIQNGKVSIISPTYPPQTFNEPSLGTRRYSYYPPTKALTVNSKFQSELTTVETIQNMLGVHELIGHGMNGYRQSNGNHFKAYELQRNHRTFDFLSPTLQQEIISRSTNPRYR